MAKTKTTITGPEPGLQPEPALPVDPALVSEVNAYVQAVRSRTVDPYDLAVIIQWLNSCGKVPEVQVRRACGTVELKPVPAAEPPPPGQRSFRVSQSLLDSLLREVRTTYRVNLSLNAVDGLLTSLERRGFLHVLPVRDEEPPAKVPVPPAAPPASYTLVRGSSGDVSVHRAADGGVALPLEAADVNRLISAMQRDGMLLSGPLQEKAPVPPPVADQRAFVPTVKPLPQDVSGMVDLLSHGLLCKLRKGEKTSLRLVARMVSGDDLRPAVSDLLYALWTGGYVYRAADGPEPGAQPEKVEVELPEKSAAAPLPESTSEREFPRRLVVDVLRRAAKENLTEADVVGLLRALLVMGHLHRSESKLEPEKQPEKQAASLPPPVTDIVTRSGDVELLLRLLDRLDNRVKNAYYWQFERQAGAPQVESALLEARGVCLRLTELLKHVRAEAVIIGTATGRITTSTTTQAKG